MLGQCAPGVQGPGHFVGFACIVVGAQGKVRASRLSPALSLLLALHHRECVFSVTDTQHIERPNQEESAKGKVQLETNFFHEAFVTKCEFSHNSPHS